MCIRDRETVDEDTIKSLNETDFYKKQHRIALRNCGVINPEIIDEYIAMDGYACLLYTSWESPCPRCRKLSRTKSPAGR